jgi:F-type H+-transporting ATPase subunit delta
MDVTIISQRYAKALFDLALEMKILEAVKKDIELLDEVALQNPEFRRLIKSPIIPAGKKNRIIAGIFKGKIEDLTFKFLLLVTRKERELFLLDINNSFMKLYKNYHNILTVHVKTRTPLEKSSRKNLLSVLAEGTHKTIDLVEKTDESMLGGFVLTMEDEKYDASIRHQLENLKKTFDKNPYISGL